MKRNLKKLGKTSLCGALVLSMVVCNGSFAEAKKVSKQESVYVNAGADGSISQVTVSNWLKDSGAVSGKLEDSTDLTDIKNVKGNETFTQDGNSVSWDTSGQDIYYQGKSSKELPVSMQITYMLDGKEMKAEDMLGKSGKLEMKISYQNHSKTTKKINGEKVDIYTPFVMVTGMILENDKFANVSIDNGRVINEGTNSIVVGIGLPGLADSLDLDKEYADNIKSEFTVTADVTDFSMGNTFTYGSPSLLDELNIDELDDLDELEEKLDDLTDAAAKLVDGSKTLSEGASTFADKMGDLKSSIKEYQKNGVKKITSGINTLSKNGPALKKGVKAYTDGADSLADGASAYVNGATQIADGNIALYEAVKNLPSQLTAFDTGLKSYTAAVDKMGSKENVSKMKNGAKAVSDGVTSLNTNLASLEASYEKNEAALEALQPLKETSPEVKSAIEGLEQLTAAQKAAITALKDATGTESDLKKGAESLSSGVNTVMDGLGTLSGKSESLTGATAQLNKNIPVLVSNVKKLKDGSQTLKKNNSALKSGAKKLKKSSKKLNASVKKLNNGMKTLQKGGKSLNKATAKLVNGVIKLEDASTTLEEGADKLYTNLDKFNDEGIEKLNDVYEDDVKKMMDRLDAVLSAGKDYKSYSGISKNMDGEVKFIIETEAVENE